MRPVALALTYGLFAAGCRGGPAPPLRTSDGREVLFYYDLGPSSVDVSGYPERARAGYRVFREKCSVCHTLARPINSPYLDPKDWKSYLERMLERAEASERVAFDGEEQALLLDFLSHDTRVRKSARVLDFIEEQAALKARFRGRR